MPELQAPAFTATKRHNFGSLKNQDHQLPDRYPSGHLFFRVRLYLTDRDFFSTNNIRCDSSLLQKANECPFIYSRVVVAGASILAYLRYICQPQGIMKNEKTDISCCKTDYEEIWLLLAARLSQRKQTDFFRIMVNWNQESQIWDGIERRNPRLIRRTGERRSREERRFDPRLPSPKQQHRNLLAFIRSLKHMRLGVDRRKNTDQRILPDRRNRAPRSLLTREEIADLLK